MSTVNKQREYEVLQTLIDMGYEVDFSEVTGTLSVLFRGNNYWVGVDLMLSELILDNAVTRIVRSMNEEIRGL